MNSLYTDQRAEAVVTLGREELLRVQGARRLRVVRGTIWLTIDDQPHDHMLEAGDEFVLARGERAVMQAIFAPASAVVAAEAAPSWPRHAGGAWRVVKHRLAEVLA